MIKPSLAAFLTFSQLSFGQGSNGMRRPCPFGLQSTSHQVHGSSVRSGPFLPHLHFESEQANTLSGKKLQINTKNPPQPNFQKLMLFHTDTQQYWLRPSTFLSNKGGLWSCQRRAATWKAFAFVEYTTWSKLRSAVSAIHRDRCIFLKILSSTLVLNLVSDAHLIFMFYLQKSSFTVSMLCLGEDRMCVCTCFYVLQRALRWSWLWRHCTNWHTMCQSKRKPGCLDTEVSI